MSTTLNKLEYLDETKDQIKTALNQFGSGITDEDTFRSYADKIDDIYNNWPKVTGEGTDIVLNNTKSALMKIGLNGNTEQDGTPTPNNPVDVKVVTGENSVKVENKNRFDVNIIQERTTNGITMSFNGQTINLSGTATGNANFYMKSNTNIVLEAGTYSIIRSSLAEIATLKLASGSDTIVSTGNTDISFTLNEETIIDGLTLQVPSSVGTINKDITIQLAKGSASPYVPHTEQNFTINLGSLELAENDYIYKSLVDGNWYKKGYVKKVVLNGTENWVKEGYSEYNLFALYNENYNNNFNDVITPIWNISSVQICKYFKVGKPGYQTTNCFSFNNTKNLMVQFNEISTLADFKTWLSTHNLVLYYVLETPTDTLITDQTLIAQLNAFEKELKSYNEQTNISQTYANLPFILTASALMKGGN